LQVQFSAQVQSAPPLQLQADSDFFEQMLQQPLHRAMAAMDRAIMIDFMVCSFLPKP